MKVLVSVICVALAIIADAAVIKDSDTIQIGNTSYRKQVLATLDGPAYDMTVSPKTGNVYFAIINGSGYNAYVIRNGAGKAEILKDSFKGQCAVYDKQADLVYIGTQHGLFEYNENTNTLTPTGIKNDIAQLFIHKKSNELYFVDYDTNKVYRVDDDRKIASYIPLEEKVNSIVIDDDSNVFYITVDNTIKSINRVSTTPYKYQGLKYGPIAIDSKGDVYSAEYSKLYKLNKDGAQVIGELDVDPTGFTFDDKDNIIFAAHETVIRYKRVQENELDSESRRFVRLG